VSSAVQSVSSILCVYVVMCVIQQFSLCVRARVCVLVDTIISVVVAPRLCRTQAHHHRSHYAYVVLYMYDTLSCVSSVLVSLGDDSAPTLDIDLESYMVAREYVPASPPSLYSSILYFSLEFSLIVQCSRSTTHRGTQT